MKKKQTKMPVFQDMLLLATRRRQLGKLAGCAAYPKHYVLLNLIAIEISQGKYTYEELTRK